MAFGYGSSTVAVGVVYRWNVSAVSIECRVVAVVMAMVWWWWWW